VLRRVSSTIAAAAVVLSGLVWAAAPASAAGEAFNSVSPASAAPSSTGNITVNVTLDVGATFNGNPTRAGYFIKLPPGLSTAGLSCANVSVSPPLAQDATTSALAGACLGVNATNGVNLASSYIAPSTTRSYTVTIVGVTTNATPQTYTLELCDYNCGQTLATTNFTVDAAASPLPSDPQPPAPPRITINIDGNGGRCTTPSVTGYQGTWATAPVATDCRRSGFIFSGFNTAADGSGIAIAPGGNLNLTTDNTLYAQYSQPRLANAPSNVVATPGLKKVTVTWQAPSDPGTGPINGYLVQASPGSSSCVTNLASANMLECTYTNLAPGTNYTFAVQALNQAGWSNFSAASNSASPYNVLLDSVSRPEVKFLVFKRGSRLEAEGRAPGLDVGTVLTPVMQIGADGAFVPLTKDTTKVNADGAFTWSRKLDRRDNGKPVSLYFTYGDARTTTLTAKLGATIGLPSAPRDLKVTSGTDGITVSWKPPARDGGSPIMEYVMKSDAPAPSWARSRVISCTVKAPSTSCTMKGNVSRLDPKKDYTFSVTAKTERGTGPQATKTWKGQVYSLNIFRRLLSGSDVTLSFTAIGWANAAQSFEVQAKVGAAGAWTKQGTARLNPDYVQSIGDWEGKLPRSATAGSEVFYRLKTDKGFSNVVTFRLSSGYEYSRG
jgi:Fibronectin type III domain/Listeria-Bacteroides repeat domain (List_Bact_rpt)